VPQLDPEKPGVSSLVLADLVEKIPMKDIASGPFAIGESRVRPRVTGVFKPSEKLWIFLKAYRLPGSVVQYGLFREGSGERIASFLDNLSQTGAVPVAQATVEKELNLGTLAPGRYTVRATMLNAGQIPIFAPVEPDFRIQ
jgi:hypothetical protein